LLAEFDLPLNRRVRKLSRGMRSALGIVIGLAARAELTLFDEPYAGLDPVARELFYARLLADYAEYPRTVLLSTHLIDEAAGLFERVVVIDRGRMILNTAADDLRGAATSVSGPAIAVAEFTAGRPVWDRRRIASQESAVVAGALDETDRARAAALHLHLEPLTLQQLGPADHQRGARLAQLRPLLHHADHRRTDRPARRPGRGAPGGRLHHRAPPHRMIHTC